MKTPMEDNEDNSIYIRRPKDKDGGTCLADFGNSLEDYEGKIKTVIEIKFLGMTLFKKTIHYHENTN